MQPASRSRRVVAACVATLALAGCADDPVQPPTRSLAPSARVSLAIAADAAASDLGTLGGLSSRAISINDSGTVVGMALDADGFARAFIWTPTDAMLPLPIGLGPFHSLAVDVNNAGQVVGYIDSPTAARAFIWSPTGGYLDLGTLGGPSAFAYGINNNGDVVGSSMTADGVSHAFIWTASGGMRDLGTLGGDGCIDGHSVAYDINDQREVVGVACAGDDGVPWDRAFRWSEATGMQNLGTTGGFFSSAYGINNRGDVVGSTQTEDGSEHAFVWNASSGMRDIGHLGGDQSVARDINEGGTVVGYSAVVDGVTHAFTWTAGDGMRDLGGLSPAASAAYSVNGSGQVAGWSKNDLDQDRATGWRMSSPNRAPAVVAGGPYVGYEGSSIAFSGSATDADGDALTVAWSFGDGAVASTDTARHTYADNASLTATFTATDARGASSSVPTSVIVGNVAPHVTASGPATIYSGDTFTLSAAFSDPGRLDAPWSTSINWGDGSATTGSTGDQSAAITGARQYLRAGRYTVSVSVTDKDTGVGTATVALEVIRAPATIDVEPRDATNTVTMRKDGNTVQVALLSTPTYDARVADPASAVITNGLGLGTSLRDFRKGVEYDYQDANRDGRPDLLLWFSKSDMIANGDLTVGTTRLILLVDDSNGRQIRGEDVVLVKP